MTPEKISPSKRKIAFQRNYLCVALITVAFAIGLLVGYFIWGQPSTTEAVAQPAIPEEEIVRYDIPTEGFPSTGPDDASIVIVEFSDFECPYCTKWHNEVYLPLIEEYPDQIKLVYRNFPLVGLHANAFLASEAAFCAGDQGEYWAYHEKLFEGEYGLGETAFLTYAQEINLDMATFSDCLTSHKYKEFVQADMDFAAELGVRSTPTFFLNGLAIVGAQPLEIFTQIIEQELAGEFSN